MPVSEIERFIRLKDGWIEKRLAERAGDGALRDGFAVGYGDCISFRGVERRVVGSSEMSVSKPNYVRGRYSGGEFLITEGLSGDDIRFALSLVLKAEAKRYIPGRVGHYAGLMGLQPEGVRITSALGRWGSCSAGRRLNFAWMLMMADDGAIDYVVVHELAHMVHMNHSADFYGLVRKYCPDYVVQKGKLKRLGRKLEREGWKR
jgi:predicted metal-dependent hydrolase